jgi:hypothetical protein
MYFDGSLNLKGVRQQGWPWALLDLGPGLELRPHTAALRRHLRLLLLTRACVHWRKVLHEDAMQDLFVDF